MSLSNFRLPSTQPDLGFVQVIADDGQVRAIARITREIIEDTFPNEDYRRDRFALVGRNLGVLRSIIQTKFDAGDYTDYADPLGTVSGNDKLIVIRRTDLVGHKLQ
jgi:hypothetical protein